MPCDKGFPSGCVAVVDFSASFSYVRGWVERYLLGHFVYMNSFALAPPPRPLIGEWLQGQVILAFHLPLLVFRTRGVGVLLNDSDLGLLLGLLSARRGRECAGVGLQGRQSLLRPLLHTIPVV